MLTWQAIIGPIAGIIGLIGFFPYFLEIFRGQTKPNRASWWIWGILGVILGISYYSSGATHSIWVPLCYAVCQLVTATLSLKFGEGGWSRLDLQCLIGAGISLLLWWILDSALIAMMACLVIDLFGAVPTLKKSYLKPDSESFLSWSIFFIANSLNLLAIGQWNFALSAYPLYLFFLSGSLVFILGTPKIIKLLEARKNNRFNRIRSRKKYMNNP